MPSLAVSIAEQIEELKRELKVRQRVYPDWAHNKRNGMTPEIAAHRIASVESTIQVLEGLLGQQSKLF